MNTLLINSAKLSPNSVTAHTRNAVILSRELGLPLASTAEEVKQLERSRFDTFVVIGAAFYPKTAEIEAWIRQGDVKKIVWVNNEYQVSPNSEYARLIKDYDSLLISNVVEAGNKCKGYNAFQHLNLNALMFDDPTERPIHKNYDLIYYGTYRPNRRLYVQKYFSESDFHISSSSKNIRKFNQLCGVNARFCDKLNWEHKRETLNRFRYSLYLEDEYTHDHFNFLANRFYECLGCNVAQFFDESCRGTFEKSGYPVLDKYFVSNKQELERKVHEFCAESSRNEQRVAWLDIAISERKLVLECLSALLISH